jgi:hypothetical protein
MEIENALTVAFGLVFIGAGILIHYNHRSFADRAVETPGEVLEVEVSGGSHRKTYYPTVRFKLADGKDLSVKLREFSVVEAGQTVTICYDPDTPEQATIGKADDIRKTGRAGLILCIPFGLAICFIGLGLELGWLKWAPKGR